MGCVVCRVRLTLATVQLHHVDYAGVSKDETGRWAARELDEDLVPMCSGCHEDLHQLFDKDPGWRRLGRRNATTTAVAKLQRDLARALLKMTTQETP